MDTLFWALNILQPFALITKLGGDIQVLLHSFERRISYSLRMASGRVNHGLIFIFEWTIPLMAITICWSEPHVADLSLCLCSVCVCMYCKRAEKITDTLNRHFIVCIYSIYNLYSYILSKLLLRIIWLMQHSEHMAHAL